MWKQFLAAYCTFTKKERTGIFVLLFLIVFFIFVPFLFPFFISSKPANTSAFEKDIATLQLKQQDSGHQFVKKDFEEEGYQNNYTPSEKNYNRESSTGELFYFDPNTTTASDWKRLGLRDKTIVTIQNYVSKGGHFYKPEDIGKIWGLHPDEIERLLPYVQIAAQENAYSEKNPSPKTYDKPKYIPSSININVADTAALIALPGIGSKLAQRIVNFRDKLGGFYKIEQVGETFGLPDSTFQKIKPRLTVNATAIKQLNINTATIDELKAHPYLRYNIANAIIQYRTQHGNFSAVADLKKIMLITEDIFVKVSPYLTVQ